MIVYHQRLLGSGGLSCNTNLHSKLQGPWIKNPGFFVFKTKENMKEIDYTKLQERIVEQAYESVLTKEQFQKLIQDKFDRATMYHQALAKSPTFSVN